MDDTCNPVAPRPRGGGILETLILGAATGSAIYALLRVISLEERVTKLEESTRDGDTYH